MSGRLPPAIYTVTQVADLLGVSRHVVRRWVERGVLPTITFEPGGKHWIPLAALRVRGLVWDSVLMRQQIAESSTVRGKAR